jgi:nitroimidazol reductase NimA-like FMN-containing flavoprotein (pyridoxamine 5'-phosphate oxidase superfamily)
MNKENERSPLDPANASPAEGGFRPMRRAERLMSPGEAEAALREENWGVLSVHGDAGYPYGVPMNYRWDGECLILHCTSGNSHRLDSIRRDPRVCFTVVPEHRLDRENWTEIYTSVIVFGTAEIVTDPEEMYLAMASFMRGLSPEKAEEAMSVCDPRTARMAMLRIRPQSITGKRH